MKHPKKLIRIGVRGGAQRPPEREVSKVSFKKGGMGSGSGQDFCRLGAGFPSARGRISVGSGPDSRGPGAERPCAREWSAAQIRKPASVRIGPGPGRGPQTALFLNFRDFHGISLNFIKFQLLGCGRPPEPLEYHTFGKAWGPWGPNDLHFTKIR